VALVHGLELVYSTGHRSVYSATDLVLYSLEKRTSFHALFRFDLPSLFCPFSSSSVCKCSWGDQNVA
jgi:hypothetical protein